MPSLVIEEKSAVGELGVHDSSAVQRGYRICSIADEEDRMTGVTSVRPIEFVVGPDLPGGALHQQRRPYVASSGGHALQVVPVLGEPIDSEVRLVDAVCA